MADKTNLSVHEKLLLTAYALGEEGRGSFSAEDLVVRAWQEFPDTFGLAGYRNPEAGASYPDSNRVFAEIMGSKPIRKRGFLAKVGEKMYQLTEAGREEARMLTKRKEEPGISKISLSRELQNRLRALLACKAADKYRNGRLEDITFHDACNFWRISPRSSAIEMQGRLANLKMVLETSRDAIRNGAATFEHSGDAFTSSDVEVLMEMDRGLQEKFRDQMGIIAQRTDER